MESRMLFNVIYQSLQFSTHFFCISVLCDYNSHSIQPAANKSLTIVNFGS